MANLKCILAKGRTARKNPLQEHRRSVNPMIFAKFEAFNSVEAFLKNYKLVSNDKNRLMNSEVFSQSQILIKIPRCKNLKPNFKTTHSQRSLSVGNFSIDILIFTISCG